MRRSILLSGLLVLGGCVHNFVPPPGQSGANLERDKATCRLAARGMQKDVAFGASGSPKFVGITMGAMAVGYAVGSAIDGAQNFNDCMLANGYLIDDGHATVHPPVLAVTSAVPVTSQPLPPPPAPDPMVLAQQVPQTPPPLVLAPTQIPLAPIVEQGSPPTVPMAITATDPTTYVPGAPYERRSFGIRAIDVSVELARAWSIIPLRGVYVVDVDQTGAGWTAGLRSGDVIVAFAGKPILSISDLATALNGMRPWSRVTATIQRLDQQTRTITEGPISVVF